MRVDMGAGRKTEKFHVQTTKAPPASGSYSTNASVSHRNLTKGNLGGVIFGCTHKTIKECLSEQLFGLPFGHFSYVRNIEPGLPLFLFNYFDRKLHGIFEAASPGNLNINSYGWTNGSERTQFPAQVQVRLRLHCQPLGEDQFKRIISDNYYTANHFWFELDHVQTSKLVSLFASFVIASSSSIPQEIVIRRIIPADFLSIILRDGVGETLTIPADDATYFNQSSGNLYPTDDFPPLDGSNQSSDSNWKTNGDEKDAVFWKLKSIALDEECQDLSSDDDPSDTSAMDNVPPEKIQDLCSEDDPRDTSAVDDMPTEKDPLEASISITKEENGEKSQPSWDYPTIIDKLVQEIAELKASTTDQTNKLNYLEGKLARAEIEIRKLNSKLQSVIDPSIQNAQGSIVEPCDEHHLDPRESIFLLGGFDSLSWLSTMDSYFPSQDMIKSLKPMNSIRSYAAVARMNEELYVFGGGIENSWFNTVDCYNITENRWTSKPCLNLSRGSLGGAVLQDKVFALGGGNGRDCFSEVEMLDLDIGRWIVTRSMLQKRFALAAVELNGVIYATGGFDGHSYLNSAERFDHREYSWIRMPNMNTRRGCHSLVVLNEKLYALGGYDGNAMTSTVEIFDPLMGSWVMGEPLNRPKGYSAAAVLNGSIYVIGGVADNGIILNTVDCHKDGQGWRETISPAIGKRCFLSAITL